MSPIKARVEAAFNRLESKLGIDREGDGCQRSSSWELRGRVCGASRARRHV